VLSIFTDGAGIQVHSGNLLDRRSSGRAAACTGRSKGSALLVPQHYPDSPKPRANFHSTVLRTGQVYSPRPSTSLARVGGGGGGGDDDTAKATRR